MRKLKYAFSGIDSIANSLRNKIVYLFLDYDGTLAPIARTPEAAKISGETRRVLMRLSGVGRCKIAVVSGRSLQDISGRINIRNIVYVGNHGFEIKGPGINFIKFISTGQRKVLENISKKLKNKFSSIRGVLIEDKNFSLSIHYRLAGKKYRLKIQKEFRRIISSFGFKKKVNIKKGKMSLEVRPCVAWNKGSAVRWLLKRHPYFKSRSVFAVYIGDDTTDEDAFRYLKGKGMTVFVGRPNNTRASFYLKNTKDVVRFMKLILKNLSEKH